MFCTIMTYEYVDVSIMFPLKYIATRCGFQNMFPNCTKVWAEIFDDTFSYINILCHNTIYFSKPLKRVYDYLSLVSTLLETFEGEFL